MHIEQWAEGDEESSGNYELKGCDCTTPTGSAEEWLAAAQALRSSEGRVSFRRLAVFYSDGWFEIWCPRNAHGLGDRETVGINEAGELSDSIVSTLKEHGEKCVFGDFDPIAMGI